MTCARCKQRDADSGYRRCAICRLQSRITVDAWRKQHRALVRAREKIYSRRYRRRIGERIGERITRRDKALAWLRTAPRTTAQIAELLGIDMPLAAAYIWQWRRQGLIEAQGTPKRGRQNRYQAI